MSLIDRVFREPELKDRPPVLVDVGASGGVTPVWRSIARHSIGVGFEPDSREAAKLRQANSAFGRWIYCECLVAPTAKPEGTRPFYLTKSPYCSSLLKPRSDRLKDWFFADLFEVKNKVQMPAKTLGDALAANGLQRIDWLKCDTQGQDLSIFLSLPEDLRRRVLAVEFEPGLIDAYQGEDKLWHTLRAMESEPFWLCDLVPCFTQRGGAALYQRKLGSVWARRVRSLAPVVPAWVNVRYLRSLTEDACGLDRRGLLLAWVFADLLRQHSHALMVADAGLEKFGGDLFAAMSARSVRRLRWAMLAAVPCRAWRRLSGSYE